ncbi:hypothetical protein CAPTEDRAFT_19335 [Capitella teleta]|uniref:BZIP domain-containing protein n=1 Tax=Capitella teleta TaxID=283909 RepID=R7V3M6_CAPTE|nr:hypothetical protein CAPTEDRAFT_19335 [Capitella teleta]|eukprot:ELU13144.1 hypothetical protein CAPTEDRAFT_19335 [Capitella teleta]
MEILHQGIQQPTDMDLIEVLWRQDIDLGAGRETFDINLRKDLEKQREVELEKERQEQLALEGQRVQETIQNEALFDPSAFELDAETGELVATQNQLSPSSSSTEEADETLSVENAMELLEQATSALNVTPSVDSSTISLEQQLDLLIQSNADLPQNVSDDVNESFSLYDGLEGATAGDQDNHSMDVNMTELLYEGNPEHVAHNHTYPLQPGQQPKEKKKSEPLGAEYTRDRKKIKAMKLPFSLEDIVESPVEHFNEMLIKYRLTEGQLQLMKDIRRRGKNKVAAQNCRKRKMEVVNGLEDEVALLKAERDRLANQKKGIHKEFASMKVKYGRLYEEVFRSLRDEEGMPYDPQRFVLQHTEDGNVYVLPREQEKTPKGKANRKRKSNH